MHVTLGCLKFFVSILKLPESVEPKQRCREWNYGPKQRRIKQARGGGDPKVAHIDARSKNHANHGERVERPDEIRHVASQRVNHDHCRATERIVLLYFFVTLRAALCSHLR